MTLKKKSLNSPQLPVLPRFSSPQRFLNYGESPRRGHVAGICLQLLAFFRFFVRHIFDCGDAYRALI
jgi:hypothetical protein